MGQMASHSDKLIGVSHAYAAFPPHSSSCFSSSLLSPLLFSPLLQFDSVPHKINTSSTIRREECVCVCIECHSALQISPVSLVVPATIALSSATNQSFSKQVNSLPSIFFFDHRSLLNRTNNKSATLKHINP